MLPISAQPVAGALIELRDGHIEQLRADVSREDAVALGDVELFDDCVLAPGFVNAHSHLEYAAYDAITDGLAFAEWIADHVQRKRRLAPGHMRASAMLGAWEAAAGGITTLGDASFSGDAAHAMHAVGLRGRVYLEVFGSAGNGDVVKDCLARLEALPSSPILHHGISPHAPYTVHEDLYRAVAATGLPWMTHLLESADERRMLLEGTGPMVDVLPHRAGETPQWGRSPVRALADILGPHVVAVHLVHADAHDAELLAERGVGIAHCPRSNARLGCGVLDLDRFERAGALLGLGTDSPASAGPLDMFAEMRSALELHRAVGGDATRPDAARVLRMATIDAAQVLGLQGVGELREGGHADIVAIRTGPTRDPVRMVVLGSRTDDVEATMVAGRVIWRRDRNELRHARERAADTRALLDLPVRQPARSS